MNKVPFTTREELNNYKLGLNNNVDEAWNTVIGDAITSLTTLSEDLPLVKGNVQYTRSDVSVPSPWANIIFFDSLLKDNTGEFGGLSTQAKADWRSLIYLIALKDVYKNTHRLNIDIEKIGLTTDSVGGYETDFFDTLKNMKPRTQIFADGDCWENFYLIKVNGCTIGVLSNSFLVCSSYKETYMEEDYKYAVEIMKDAGLMDDDYNLMNPTEKIKQDFSLLVYMIEYLKTLKSSIIKTNITDKTRVPIKEVCALIDDFIGELKNNLSEQYMSKCDSLTGEDNKLYTFAEITNAATDAYDLFSNIKLEIVNLNTVEEMIKLKRSNNALLDRLGVSLEKIINANKGIELKAENMVIFTAEDKFLDKITLVDCFEGKSPFEKFSMGKMLEGEEKRKYCCLLPLNEKFLDMFDSEYEARENVKISGNYDEGLDVTLKFVIDGKEITEEKHYNKEDYNIVSDTDIPFVAIWPYADIKSVDSVTGNKVPAWKDFYIFREIKEYDTNSLMKYNPCEVEIKSRKQLDYSNTAELKDKKDGKKRLISHMDVLPTYMQVKKANNMDVLENIGIIIFKKPEIESVINPNNKRYVGMDFGTTSTTAFCCENINDGRERFIKFGTMTANTDRSKIEGIVAFDDSVKVDWKNDSIGGDDNGCCIVYCSDVNPKEPALNFVPTKYSAHKFYPSIFKINTNDATEDIKRHSLLSGNILYDAAIKDEDVNRNLKWGRRSNQAMEGYLAQFMVNIAFTLAKEGVGQIIWRFSYPTSLSESEERNFRGRVIDIVDQINKTTGIISETEQNTFFTESIVSAKFYKGANDYLCVDIGGGSTDVSLWRGSLQEEGLPENLMQFSVGIASRKIFTEALANAILNCRDVNDRSKEKIQNNIRKIDLIYEDIFDTTKAKISPEGHMVSKDKDSIATIMEAFGREMEPAIHSNGNNIMDWIMSSTISDDIMRDSFFKYIVTGFFGLLYYTVLSMKPLKEELKDINYLKVNLAGNGSNIYEWLMRYFRASDNSEKIFSNALSKLVEKELGLNINFEISLDKGTLKNEAARGLLKMENDAENIYTKNITIVNGDEMKVDYKDGSSDVWSYDAVLSDKKDLVDYYSEENRNRTSIENIDIPYNKHSKTMQDFISSLNEYIFTYSDLELDIDKEIPIDEMQRILRNTLKRNVNNGTLAPAFIIELEAVLNVLAGYHKPAVKNI